MPANGPCVLVVEPEEQAHCVLEAALAPRGVQVLSARLPREALAAALRRSSDVIVADDEADVGGLLRELRRAGRVAPRVLILGEPGDHDSLPALRKPYDCRTLIRRIEAMLAVVPAAENRSAGPPLRRAA